MSPQSAPAPARQKLVLIVEDEAHVSAMTAQFLRSEGYVVYIASNGQEALTWLRQHTPSADLILLDLLMPVMDGFQFLQVRQHDPGLAAVPVVVVTARKDGAAQVVRGWGAQAFLLKPYHLDDLLSMVRRFTANAPEATADRGAVEPGGRAASAG